ncbi:uncharacterized protein MKK02DRAFT_39366 [Dioszegia hungarica]|uniref:Uncharacterized protein n=1 Tax=Dioszegia hungarica TaxID=4972 RepID=A0AA38LXW9_9TREE|nr:uncharacterized protein MKK02DRAFT_39366 [Dioszegia hungarica]KAI9639088.1 hypothetical protein MKK02DRAFT_39366 [Dioszegia hungarica]
MSPRKTLANPSYTPIPHPATPYKTFDSFYPFYLGEHSSRINRLFHLTGSSIALTIYARVLLSLVPRILDVVSKDKALVARLGLRWGLTGKQMGKWLATALVQGYACAWVGHFFVEKNRPATFKYPLYSLRGDFRMLWEYGDGSEKEKQGTTVRVVESSSDAGMGMEIDQDLLGFQAGNGEVVQASRQVVDLLQRMGPASPQSQRQRQNQGQPRPGFGGRGKQGRKGMRGMSGQGKGKGKGWKGDSWVAKVGRAGGVAMAAMKAGARGRGGKGGRRVV